MTFCHKEVDEVVTEEGHGMSQMNRNLTLSTGQRGCVGKKKTNVLGNEKPQRTISQWKLTPLPKMPLEN